MSLLLICVLIGGLQSIGYSTDSGVQSKEPTPEEKELSIEEKWGVRIVGIRLTASDYMLDFRYHVIHPEKASDLLQKQTKPFLIHQTTAKRFDVPRTRLGPLRQTGVKPIADRDYIIFSVRVTVKRGDKVISHRSFKVEDRGRIIHGMMIQSNRRNPGNPSTVQPVFQSPGPKKKSDYYLR
jgi:hypothetical protein